MLIPSTIEVGFQKRTHKGYRDVNNDEYHDGPSYLLGYATFREKGKLRKEISWEGWRDKNIPPQVLSNCPREGFKFAEFDKRSSEWFGSGRTMWRISDPYGFDLEITSDNLMSIICNCNIIEGQLEGEFVWAWEGKNLCLLSTNSETYRKSIIDTHKKNASSVSTKDLNPGDIIEFDNGSKYVFHDKLFAIRKRDSYHLSTVLIRY